MVLVGQNRDVADHLGWVGLELAGRVGGDVGQVFSLHLTASAFLEHVLGELGQAHALGPVEEALGLRRDLGGLLGVGFVDHVFVPEFAEGLFPWFHRFGHVRLPVFRCGGDFHLVFALHILVALFQHFPLLVHVFLHDVLLDLFPASIGGVVPELVVAEFRKAPLALCGLLVGQRGLVGNLASVGVFFFGPVVVGHGLGSGIVYDCSLGVQVFHE